MSSRPSQTRKPWADMTAREKNEAALPLFLSGKSFGAVAKLIGAPSRNAVATISGRLVKAGKLPAATRSGRKASRPKSTNTPRGRSGTAREAPGGHPLPGDGDIGDLKQGAKPAARTLSSPSTSSRSETPAGAAEPPPFAAPVPTWTQMSPNEKRVAVKARILEGQSMGAIAAALGAPNRGSIGSVADRLRTLGELPRRDLAETGREGRLVQRMNSPAMQRSKSEASFDRHIARRMKARIEAPKADPGLPISISTAVAWDALEGHEPVALVDIPLFGQCRWPVEVDAPGHFMCGAPCDATSTYCSSHAALSRSPYQPKDRKAA